MGTHAGNQPKHQSSIVSLFITLTVLFFVLLAALLVVKIIFGIFFALAPVMGIIVAAMGGMRYVKADEEGEKLDAMKWIAAGLAILVLGIIF